MHNLCFIPLPSSFKPTCLLSRGAAISIW